MRTPLYVRAITEQERKRLEAGLRSKDAFVLRRCQIVLASARGQRAPANESMAGQVTDASIWHINADERSVLNYNTEYKTAAQIVSLYAADEYRSSDHDPVIVELHLGLERLYLPMIMCSY